MPHGFDHASDMNVLDAFFSVLPCNFYYYGCPPFVNENGEPLKDKIRHIEMRDLTTLVGLACCAGSTLKDAAAMGKGEIARRMRPHLLALAHFQAMHLGAFTAVTQVVGLEWSRQPCGLQDGALANAIWRRFEDADGRFAQDLVSETLIFRRRCLPPKRKKAAGKAKASMGTRKKPVQLNPCVLVTVCARRVRFQSLPVVVVLQQNLDTDPRRPFMAAQFEELANVLGRRAIPNWGALAGAVGF